jgi:ABC-type antimicrobial peptide transport system permease subunit
VLRQIGRRMATDKMIMCLILGLFIGVVGIIVAKVSWASLSSVGVLGFPLLLFWACLLVFSFPLFSLVLALLKSAPPPSHQGRYARFAG